MGLWSHRQAQRKSRLFTSVVALVLVASVLAPKVSLAIGVLLGEGYRTVVLCTGSELRQVTISPDGSVVNDISQSWQQPDGSIVSMAHCVFHHDTPENSVRHWERIIFATRVVLYDEFTGPPVTRHPHLLSLLSSRGPPA